MDTVLGLILLVVYMTAIVSIAAGITWLVVKLSPSKSAKTAKTAAAPPAA